MGALVFQPQAAGLADLSLQERAGLQYELEQFLFEEAALLDARRYQDWFGLLTEDIHYWMPIRRTVTRSDLDVEFTEQGGVAHFDDDIHRLKMRLAKLDSSTSWSENPPSRTRHFVSNVRILEIADAAYTVECAFWLYRTRMNDDENHFVGRRQDIIRRTDEGLKLAQRHIYLDQTVLHATNLSSLI